MAQLILSLFIFFPLVVFADVVCTNEVSFSENLFVTTPSGPTASLELNGVDLKRVLFFKVFYAGLYLENKSQDANQILQSTQTKVGIVHTVRNVSESQLVNMWNDEYERLCGSKCNQMRPFHDKFISYARDVQKHERLALLFFRDRFEFEINGNEFFDPIMSPDYAHLLQRVLIGPEAEDKNLEDQLLGKKTVCN